MKISNPAKVATVSSMFVDDWFKALENCRSKQHIISFRERANLYDGQGQPVARVTLDQIVDLYKIAAIETEDEMMGLWGRPVRLRALQHLLATVRDAKSLSSALFKFSTFWNLLLDDYQFELRHEEARYVLALVPIGEPHVQRFGHMLILKLAHGLLSWLVGSEVPVEAVQFAFEEPEFAEDYSVIFPTQIEFGATCSTITFDLSQYNRPLKRSDSQMIQFLNRAPRDWIFTNSHEHALSLQIREVLYRTEWVDCKLANVAKAFKLEPRTLIRRLKEDGTSFQEIKDGLRRDIAIQELQDSKKSIEEISQNVGFSSAANFHIAFRRWTGSTPSMFR